uniref:Zinc finger protein RFP-like isoform X1 n=1 Tax=Pogona vitticeps TaxID=103695 RepID=A0ABM5FH20_9SAUR
MALSSSSTSVENAAGCPICFECLTHPVTLDCGHNFCRGCITKYCEEWEWTGELECPICKAKFQKGHFRPNWQLASLVQEIKQSQTQDLCLQHKEKLHLFCKEDRKLVCFVCERSPEHKEHTMILKEVAAQEYKDLLTGPLELLKQERTQVLKCKEEREKESHDLLRQTKAEMEKMKTEFQQQHQFLEEQEKLLMAQMEEVEKEIARKREEHLARLSEELSSLGGLIRKMEQKRQQPPEELLQDVQGILQSYEKKETFQYPPAFPPELKSKIQDVRDKNTFLAERMKQFRDAGSLAQKANVTLDPKTAHPKLILSEDLKSVRHELKSQDVPNNPERFNIWPFVLGSEGFTAGRHYWEVTVGNEGAWAVGVARKSIRRKHNVGLETKEGIWAVGKWEGEYKAFSDPPQSFLPFSGKLRRIRVSLSYEEEQVAFHDANTASHLHTFYGATFSGETLLPFFCVDGKGSLTILRQPS